VVVRRRPLLLEKLARGHFPGDAHHLDVRTRVSVCPDCMRLRRSTAVAVVELEPYRQYKI
jgi:hypothetical protein